MSEDTREGTRSTVGRQLERSTPRPYLDLDSSPVALHSARDVPAALVNALADRHVQLEIFPEVRHIEAIDPRIAIGRDTRVKALYRVRYGESRQVHEICHDRHGWYCAEHGPKCPAVSDATTAASPR